MELRFAIATVVEIIASVLLVLGVAYEDKLIDFEDAIETKIARWIAMKIIKKRGAKNERRNDNQRCD